VDVRVQDSLACRHAVVESHVEAVRRELLQDPGACPRDQRPEGGLLRRRQLEEAGDVPPRDDQRMALGHGTGVAQGKTDLVPEQDA
jgi:hypothetical protein